MTVSSTAIARSIPSARARTRLLTVGAAALATTAIWTLAVQVFGVQLLVHFGGGTAQTVGVAYVLMASLSAALVGWALLAALERRNVHAIVLWTRVAVGVLVVSLALPLSAGTTTATRAVLVTMHVVAAAVIIWGMRRGA